MCVMYVCKVGAFPEHDTTANISIFMWITIIDNDKPVTLRLFKLINSGRIMTPTHHVSLLKDPEHCKVLLDTRLRP